jgi:hypothetical protein
MQRRFLPTLTIGLVAAAGAFGTAAMMSGVTAPTARADDLTDILAGVEADFTSGQTAFADAAADLSSSNAPGALAEFFTGVDEDFVLAPDSLFLGSVQALTGEPVSNAITLSFGAPSDLADALAGAQSSFTVGQTEFTDALTALGSGDYATAVDDNALGSLFAFDIPIQEVLIGAVAQLGL